VQLFGTKGQKFFHCLGTTGQTKNLAKGWDGPEQPKFGTGCRTKLDRAEKENVLKQKNDVLKQKMMF